MNRPHHAPCLLISILLLAALPIHAQSHLPPAPLSDLIYVDDDNTQGPWDGSFDYPYKTINQAIENATSGDRIFILEGYYPETFTISKPLYLFGDNQSSTIIDGIYHDTIITISAENVSLYNLSIKNSGGNKNDAAIKTLSSYTSISRCLIYRSRTGVLIANTTNSLICLNMFHSNGAGIAIHQSSSIEITNNTFEHNAIGIELHKSTQCSISRCMLHTNGEALFAEESTHLEIINSGIYNNNDNQGGIVFLRCQQSIISNNHINHNGFAIRLLQSISIQISRCSFKWNNHVAVRVQQQSDNITIFQCDFSDHFLYGVTIYDSRVTFTNNNLYDSLWGLYAENAQITARMNWWGSPLGPSRFDQKIRDRIGGKQSRIQTIPWSIKKHSESGAQWKLTESQPLELPIEDIPIRLPGKDSDQDGAPDWWEDKWGYPSDDWNDHAHLDPDKDALTNLQECYTDEDGSNPFEKDIFLEFDWVESQNPSEYSNKPPTDLLFEVKEIFAAHEITLHVDDGSRAGGEEIPYISNFSYDVLRDLYWDYFLHNDLTTPRKGIYHYCLVCDVGPNNGFAFVGWDHLDSFCISADILQQNQPQRERGRLIVGGAIHELGHTLGLFIDDFFGIDNHVATKPLTFQFFRCLPYKSCMNYQYTYQILGYSDGSRLFNDQNDWELLDYSFFKDTSFPWPQE